MFNLICFNTISNVILISWKVCVKMKPRGFALHCHCDPQPRSKSVKMVQNWWKSMVPIRIADMKKFGWTVYMYCPTLKFLPCKTAAWPASWMEGWTNTTYYTEPYDTHMDQKDIDAQIVNNVSVLCACLSTQIISEVSLYSFISTITL